MPHKAGYVDLQAIRSRPVEVLTRTENRRGRAEGSRPAPHRCVIAWRRVSVAFKPFDERGEYLIVEYMIDGYGSLYAGKTADGAHLFRAGDIDLWKRRFQIVDANWQQHLSVTQHD